MRTEFALLAIYEKTLIPLEQFCVNEMGIAVQTAKKPNVCRHLSGKNDKERQTMVYSRLRCSCLD